MAPPLLAPPLLKPILPPVPGLNPDDVPPLSPSTPREVLPQAATETPTTKGAVTLTARSASLITFITTPTSSSGLRAPAAFPMRRPNEPSMPQTPERFPQFLLPRAAAIQRAPLEPSLRSRIPRGAGRRGLCGRPPAPKARREAVRGAVVHATSRQNQQSPLGGSYTPAHRHRHQASMLRLAYNDQRSLLL